MGNVHEHWHHKRAQTALHNSRGISLLIIVLLMVAVGAAALGMMTFGAKLRAVDKNRATLARMETVRRALQNYYLSHHNLPPLDPENPNRIPAADLNLPQEYRLDNQGEFIHYDLRFHDGAVVNIRGLSVQSEAAAAVLVAPGPDRVMTSQDPADPDVYRIADGSDDVVMGISLHAEAMKIASRALSLLQAAARAYDAQFDNYNNDADLCYPRWYSFIDPGDPLDPADDRTVYVTPRPYPYRDEGNYEGNYMGDCCGEVRPNGALNPPCPAIDRFAGYVGAVGGSGTGCIRYGQLTNDPERGTASLDGCSNPAQDIAAVFGLSRRYAVDPWNRVYQWGSASQYGGLQVPDADRNRRYWFFYSMGPDGQTYDPTQAGAVDDDIVPTTDKIEGFFPMDPPRYYQ